MYYRIIIYLGLSILASCSSAKMAMNPGLEVNSDKFQISQRPAAFTGGDLVFGPYKATKISRGFIKSSSWDIAGYGSEKSGQNYSYYFNGKGSWTGECKVATGNINLSIISAGYYADINCRFLPVDSASATESGWKFSIKGETSGTAEGHISVGSKIIEVAAIDKIEGSSLRMSQHTGYYFYADGDIVAGVDTISKEGPVWLNKNLSRDEKDIIGLVVVALLLNQV